MNELTFNLSQKLHSVGIIFFTFHLKLFTLRMNNSKSNNYMNRQLSRIDDASLSGLRYTNNKYFNYSVKYFR